MSTGRNTKAPTSDLLAGKTTTEPANLTPKGFGPSILALEAELGSALVAARRFRRLGLPAAARLSLVRAARLVPELLEEARP